MASITTTRLAGMMSGMDTDTIIQNLMKAQQLKVNRELRSRTTLKWKQESLKSVAADTKSFRQTYMSALSSSNMLSDSVFNAFKVSTTGKDTSSVTITASTGASVGNVTVNSIEKLATGTVVGARMNPETGEVDQTITSGISADGKGFSNSTKLADLEFANGQKLNFDEDGNISFKINDTEFTFNESDSLQTMINKVNASDAGVTMKYSGLSDQITFESKDTGANTSITFENVNGGNMFGEDGDAGVLGVEAGTYANGNNAELTIDGFKVEKESNTFTIDGITYTLNAETQDATKATITRDVDNTVDKVKGFVDAYNSLIDKLNTMIKTRKSSSESSYTPLTDDEKAEMTDKQIEEWEAIAKKGVMYNDQGIKDMMSSLRAALYDKVEGAGMSAADIGLRTGSNYSDGGQIVLDEDALRAALEKDPDAVTKVFTQFSDDKSGKGLLNRMNDIMISYERNANSDSQSSVESSIKKLDDRITTLEDKLAALEEKYYLKFAAMETALSKLQSQSDSIASLLGTSS